MTAHIRPTSQSNEHTNSPEMIRLQAIASLRKPHMHSDNPYFPEYAAFEAAQNLKTAMKGGRKANPDVEPALLAAHQLEIRLSILQGGVEDIPAAPPTAPDRQHETGDAGHIGDAAKDARQLAKLTHFWTGTYFSRSAEPRL